MGTDWRVIDGVATAWYDAASLVEGAALAARVMELSAEVDLRPDGVRVRLTLGADTKPVSAAAHDLGLTANPAVLQQLSIVFESANPSALKQFWQPVLNYEPSPDGGLTDPLHRDPAVRIRQSTDPRPLRNRIHLDVVRPAASVEQVSPSEPSGPYGVCHPDPDGNEVDLVPGDPLGEGVADWQAVFSAIACYRVTPTQQRDLTTTAATLAHEAGFPLLIDLRPGLVILDTGKDLWEPDAHGLNLDFPTLAASLQTAAHALGATPAPELPRFTQLFLDAADVPTLRTFWQTALGYTTDRRTGLTDLHDPHRLNPVLVFQALDPTDTTRRDQRNRIHFELAVPADAAQTRLATILAAGGQLLEQSGHRWDLSDPEGNELTLIGER